MKTLITILILAISLTGCSSNQDEKEISLTSNSQTETANFVRLSGYPNNWIYDQQAKNIDNEHRQVVDLVVFDTQTQTSMNVILFCTDKQFNVRDIGSFQKINDNQYKRITSDTDHMFDMNLRFRPFNAIRDGIFFEQVCQKYR